MPRWGGASACARLVPVLITSKAERHSFMTSYASDFNPTEYRLEPHSDVSKTGQDLRDGSVYVYDERIMLAVRVALATGRPLLLLGPPGSGKSSLAAYVPRVMTWN